MLYGVLYSICTHRPFQWPLQLTFVAMVKRGSGMVIPMLVRACGQTSDVQPLPKYFSCRLHSFQQIENTWIAEKLPTVCLVSPCNIILAISKLIPFYSWHQSNMRLSRETFHYREIHIRIFCIWFIHEGEQTYPMGNSPKWKVHVCLDVLWFHPFSASWLLRGPDISFFRNLCASGWISTHIYVLCYQVLDIRVFCLHLSPHL